jgi:hypothetical protein
MSVTLRAAQVILAGRRDLVALLAVELAVDHILPSCPSETAGWPHLTWSEPRPASGRLAPTTIRCAAQSLDSDRQTEDDA